MVDLDVGIRRWNPACFRHAQVHDAPTETLQQRSCGGKRYRTQIHRSPRLRQMYYVHRQPINDLCTLAASLVAKLLSVHAFNLARSKVAGWM